MNHYNLFVMRRLMVSFFCSIACFTTLLANNDADTSFLSLQGSKMIISQGDNVYYLDTISLKFPLSCLINLYTSTGNELDINDTVTAIKQTEKKGPIINSVMIILSLLCLLLIVCFVILLLLSDCKKLSNCKTTLQSWAINVLRITLCLILVGLFIHIFIEDEIGEALILGLVISLFSTFFLYVMGYFSVFDNIKRSRFINNTQSDKPHSHQDDCIEK